MPEPQSVRRMLSLLMRVAALQFDIERVPLGGSGAELRGAVQSNVESVLAGLAGAATDQVRLVLLPELWSTSFVAAGGPFGDATRLPELMEAVGAAEAEVTAAADRAGIALAGSALAREPGDELPRNRFTLHDAGAELLRYDKAHLFTPTGEHLAFSAGTALPPVAELDGLRVAGLVCYDLRFSDPLEALHRAACDLVLVPAQWPTPRVGHWSALLAGRAVSTQAFVLGANRTGSEALGRRGVRLEFPGASALHSPSGVALVAGSDAPGLVVAELDPRLPALLRRQVPVQRDRRDDLA